MIKNLLLFIMFFVPTMVFATDYTIVKKGEVRTIMSSWGATWTGYISTDPKKLPIGQESHKVSFDFSSPDYFKVGINGNGYTIEGRGVVLGNVFGYPDAGAGCFGSTEENAVVFESFWKTGNCVMGWSESVPLRVGLMVLLSIVCINM